MSPSLPPSGASVPSLAEMLPSGAARNEKDPSRRTTSPGATASSVSSDLSTGSNANCIGNGNGAMVQLGSGALPPPCAIINWSEGAPDAERFYYYLSPEAARRLPDYKYHGEDRSALYKYVLSPLATWLVENCTPAWLAPNSITLIGLGWMGSSYLVIWYWCPGMHEANSDLSTSVYSVPSVIFLLNGIAMLIYQTLDNMDGKQSRKTGSSSPLGLLFDHGCDAINSVFGSANWIAAMAMIPGNVGDLVGTNDHGNIQGKSLLSGLFGGDAMLAALLILCPMIAFFVSTWEQYYTGKLILPPFNGPSDGLVMGAMLSFASFAWGPMYWQATSLADDAIDGLESWEGGDVGDGFFSPLRGRVRNMDLIVFASIVGLAQEVMLKIIFVTQKYGFQSLRTVVPNMLLAASTFAMVHCDQELLLRCPRVLMHLISGLFTEQCTQLMLDHMVEEDFTIGGRWALFPMVFLALGMVVGVSPSAQSLDTILLMYTTALWVYLAFKICVLLSEMCDVLSIYLLDIVTPHPKKSGKEGPIDEPAPAVDAAEARLKKTN